MTVINESSVIVSWSMPLSFGYSENDDKRVDPIKFVRDLSCLPIIFAVLLSKQEQ